MKPSGATSSKFRPVDMTAMIDVVFLLIIFFMVTSHLGDLRRTEIDLPKEEGEQKAPNQEHAMIVDIDGSGTYILESQSATLNEIDRVARSGIAASSDPTLFDVLVRPDQNAPAIALDRLLLRLTQAGVTNWKLATEPGRN